MRCYLSDPSAHRVSAVVNEKCSLKTVAGAFHVAITCCVCSPAAKCGLS